ncbi:MAG: HEAT repeat domain-containing protein [Planctomycetota bacterium]|nr:HEAT repeat domain-containing protein [Planctomycetota bacterium]
MRCWQKILLISFVIFGLAASAFAQQGAEEGDVEKAVNQVLSIPPGEERKKAVEELAKSGHLVLNALRQTGKESAEAKRLLSEVVDVWVRWLDDEDGEKRFSAESYLFEAGEYSVEALKKASEGGGSLNLRTTVRRLLNMIRFKVSAELYRRVGGTFAEYEKQPVRERIGAVLLLEQMGGTEAIPALKQLVLEEKDETVRLVAADALVRTGDISVLKFLKELGLSDKINTPPDRYILMLSQGIRFMQVEDYRNAMEEFSKILKEYPEDYNANYQMAMCYLFLKEYHNSVKHFKICLKERPNDSVLHYNMACAYALLGHKELAFEHLEKAFEYGYRDAAHTEADEDLRSLRDDDRFKRLLERMRKDGRDGTK